MKRFEPYLPILGALVLGLIRLVHGSVRNAVLPGRKRSGNLASSLYLLFAGVAEQLLVFRRAILLQPLTLKIPARDRLESAWRFATPIQ